jgi:hypothetical protein
MERQHADFMVFPAVAGHFSATGKEHEIRGTVRLVRAKRAESPAKENEQIQRDKIIRCVFL